MWSFVAESDRDLRGAGKVDRSQQIAFNNAITTPEDAQGMLHAKHVTCAMNIGCTASRNAVSAYAVGVYK